jgi:putative transposase
MIQYSHLLPNQYFHIVHCAVAKELLFVHKGNKDYFLRQYSKYIVPTVHTLAYYLMPKHFHFMVPIKSEEELAVLFEGKFPFREWDPSLAADFLMQYWSNLLNSYSKSFNKKHKRKGMLFIDYLKRVKIVSNEQCCDTIFYMHSHAVQNILHFFVGNNSILWKGYPFFVPKW